MFTRIGNRKNIESFSTWVIKGAQLLNQHLQQVKNDQNFEEKHKDKIQKIEEMANIANINREEQIANLKIRMAYTEAEKEIPNLLPSEEFEIGPSDDNKIGIYASAAEEIRRGLRLQAREEMPNIEHVKALQERDLQKYKDPDGPTSEHLTKKYDEIQGTKIPSPSVTNTLRYYAAQRSDTQTNEKFGIKPSTDEDKQNDQGKKPGL